MIELTDEMFNAFYEAGVDRDFLLSDTRAGLAAVLAIVERDYVLTGRTIRTAPETIKMPEQGMCDCRPREGAHEFGVEGCRGFE